MEIKNNMLKQKVENMEKDANRFSIRKLSIGAASVLIGLTLMGVEGQTVKADTSDASQETTQTENSNKAEEDAGKISTKPVVSQEPAQEVNDQNKNGGVNQSLSTGNTATKAPSSNDTKTTTLNIDTDKNVNAAGLKENKAADPTNLEYKQEIIIKDKDNGQVVKTLTLKGPVPSTIYGVSILEQMDFDWTKYDINYSYGQLSAINVNVTEENYNHLTPITIQVSPLEYSYQYPIIYRYNNQVIPSKNGQPVEFKGTLHGRFDIANITVGQIEQKALENIDPNYQIDPNNNPSLTAQKNTILVSISQSNYNKLGSFEINVIPAVQHYSQKIIYQYNGQPISSKNNQPVEITGDFNPGSTATITVDDIKSTAESNLNPNYQIPAGQPYSPVTVNDSNYNNLPPIVINVTPIPRDYTQKIIYQYAGKTIAPKTGTDPKLTGTLDSNNKATISAHDIQLAVEGGLNPDYVINTSMNPDYVVNNTNNTYQFKDENINSQTPADLVVEVQPRAYKDWVITTDQNNNVYLQNYKGTNKQVTVPNNIDLGVDTVFVDGGHNPLRYLFFSNLNDQGITDVTISKTQGGVVNVLPYMNDGGISMTQSNYLFGWCHNFKHLDLTNLDTHNMTNAEGLFYDDINLESIEGLNNWKLPNLGGNLDNMFYNNQKLKSLDLTGWNLKNMQNISAMFMNCLNLNSITGLNTWDVSTATDTDNMFAVTGTSNLKLDLSNWKLTSDKNLSHMFFNCGASYINLNGVDISNATDVGSMFMNLANPATVDMRNMKLPTATTFHAADFNTIPSQFTPTIPQPLVVFSDKLGSLNQEAVSNGIGHPANIITLYAGDALPSTLRAMPSPIGHVQMDFVYANPEDFNTKLANKLKAATINQNNNDYNLIDAFKNKHVYSTSPAQDIPEDNYPARVAGMWNLFFNPQTPTGQTYKQAIEYKVEGQSTPIDTVPEAFTGQLPIGGKTLTADEVNAKIKENLPAGYKIVSDPITQPITITSTTPNPIIVTIAPVEFNVKIEYKDGRTVLGSKTISGNLIDNGTSGQKNITLNDLKDFPANISPDDYKYVSNESNVSNDKGITADHPFTITNPENITITVYLTKNNPGGGTTGGNETTPTHTTERFDQKIIYQTSDNQNVGEATIPGTLTDGVGSLSAQEINNAIDTNMPDGYTYVSGKVENDLAITSTNPAIIYVQVKKNVPNTPSNDEEHEEIIPSQQPDEKPDTTATVTPSKEHPVIASHKAAWRINHRATYNNGRTLVTRYNNARKLPQTGSKDETLAAALGLAALSASAIIGLADRRKKN